MGDGPRSDDLLHRNEEAHSLACSSEFLYERCKQSDSEH